MAGWFWVVVMLAPSGSRARNSPDNLAHNAPSEQAPHAQLHNAYLERTPKMPGEPPRVQPSRMNRSNWDST